jgi:hypothetical protein
MAFIARQILLAVVGLLVWRAAESKNVRIGSLLV